MENRNEDNLIDEFNELVSEISKSVFDKSIYKDLKLTEENLIKTLASTSEKTATVNRNNLISLQNNLKVILDDAISDFNLGIEQGEQTFEKKANEFLNNIEELSSKSRANIYVLQEKAKEAFNEIEALNRQVGIINKNICELSQEEGIHNISTLQVIAEDLTKSIKLSNNIAMEHIGKIEEMDRMLKGECLKIMNSVNKLENRLKINKMEVGSALAECKECIESNFDRAQHRFKLDLDELKDLLEEGNTNMDNSIELLNSTIAKYNVDAIDATRRLGDKINNIDKKMASNNKEIVEPYFNDELKSEFEKKYYFLVSIVAIVGVLAVLF
ncbi:hypothetical protein GNF80_17270 [Clostridium perfringens]|nr:hypothetical protein [Clostridium perfringens]